jgi:hypothetical protein
MSKNVPEFDCNRIIVHEVGEVKPSEHRFAIGNSVKEIIIPENLIKMYELEFNEKYNDDHSSSHEDRRFSEKIENRISYIHGHYQMPLPFRDVDTRMPSNREQAIQRAYWLKKGF